MSNATSFRSRYQSRLVVLVAVVIVAVAAFPLEAKEPAPKTIDDGRTADDLALEEFLTKAEIVSSEPLGMGITKSRKLTLRHNGIERHAVLKTVDVQSTNTSRTNRLEITFRDCYLYEVAAYRLDRLFGLGLVPVTILRELSGEQASLQIWVDDVVNLREVFESPTLAANGDPNKLKRCLTSMYVLDSLISNVDRNWDNVLVNPSENQFALIDHSRSFRMNNKVEPPYAENGVMSLEPEMANRLQKVNKESLDNAVGGLLSRAQMRCLVKRHKSLLNTLAKNGFIADEQGR